MGISEDEFTELSPSLVQQIVQGCATHEEDSGADPSPGESEHNYMKPLIAVKPETHQSNKFNDFATLKKKKQ